MTEPAEGLPLVYTPEDVAKHMGWSPRKLREKARGDWRVQDARKSYGDDCADVDALLDALMPRVQDSPRFSTYLKGTRSTNSHLSIPVREEDAYEEAMRLASRKNAKPKKR